MPYRGYTSDEDEGKKSEYNAAALKMKRLDKLLDGLNDINGNLFAWNEEFGVFNYQLKFSWCTQLYQEVESKLNTKERTNGLQLQNHIKKFLNQFPVYKKSKKKTNADENIKSVIINWLGRYETLVREYIDNHGMDTRYEDESGL